MTAESRPAVTAARPEDEQAIFDMLTRAFAADPPNRWMYPEDRQYVRYFPAFTRALGGAAIAQGTAFVCEGGAGAALWLSPDTGPDEEALMALIAESVADEKKADMFAVAEAMGRHHPAEPHWYLPFIGVDPLAQGRGLGAALLDAFLPRCDAESLPAYLESTNPRNRPLYERHGFRAVGEIRVGSCPPVVPMLRQPRV